MKEEQEEEVPTIKLLWVEWLAKDLVLQWIQQAIEEGRRSFPAELKLKVSIGKCEIQEQG